MPPYLHTSSNCEYVDPRVRRTRQMLEEALESLLATTAFENISVGDIAEAATLNRATFYGHFVDKFDLLESLVASRFQNLLDRRGVAFDGQCSSALYGIALAVCDYLYDTPFCTEQRQMAQYMESAMVTIVRGMIVEGLKHHPSQGSLPSEIVAAALAGAIYGAAKEWVRIPERPSAEEAAASITTLIKPLMASR